jgi:hypothetical protein
MRRRVAKRKHCAPGMSNDRWFPAADPRYHFIKVHDMLRDSKRCVAAASLQWFRHAK